MPLGQMNGRIKYHLPTLMFLKQKGFQVIADDTKLVTNFPIKIQSHPESNTHAVAFKSAQDFSDWVNRFSGCKTRAIGEAIFWDKISNYSLALVAQFRFFHKPVDLEKDQLDQFSPENAFEVIELTA